MEPMTKDEIVLFMRSGSRTGKLAVTRADGQPLVLPIWFDFDDESGELVFLTAIDSLKGRCLRRDGRVSICVDRMEMPFDFARIDGTTTLIPYADDPTEVLTWATITCRRYVGRERAEEFGRRNAVPEEMLVRVTPTRYIGARGVSA